MGLWDIRSRANRFTYLSLWRGQSVCGAKMMLLQCALPCEVQLQPGHHCRLIGFLVERIIRISFSDVGMYSWVCAQRIEAFEWSSFFFVAPTAVRLGKETHLVRTGDCPGCVQYPKECSFRLRCDVHIFTVSLACFLSVLGVSNSYQAVECPLWYKLERPTTSILCSDSTLRCANTTPSQHAQRQQQQYGGVLDRFVAQSSRKWSSKINLHLY